MKQIINAIVQSIYSVVCMMVPHHIVLGGDVINNHPFFINLIKSHLRHFLIPEHEGTIESMEQSKLKKDSGAIGAALNCRENLKQDFIKNHQS